jgi:predicted nucleic acid-binding protein
MNRIYLDSNILIAYYSQDKPEEAKKKASSGKFVGE